MKKIRLIGEHNDFLDYLSNYIMKNGFECIIENHKKSLFLPKFIANYLYIRKLTKTKFDYINVCFRPYSFADIYWHFGFNNKNIKNILKNAKKIIVSSLIDQEKFEKFFPKEKIQLIYQPLKFHDDILVNRSQISEFIGKDCIDQKIIFHISENLKVTGFLEFINIVKLLEQQNYIAIAYLPKKLISQAEFFLTSLGINDRIKLIELLPNLSIDDILNIGDIFVYPTKSKKFAKIIGQAMMHKCAVFVTNSNPSSEIVDYFATMQGVNDSNTSHKIDALLCGEDLDFVKNANYQMAQIYTYERTAKKLFYEIEQLALKS